jgi:hypothetical protein
VLSQNGLEVVERARHDRANVSEITAAGQSHRVIASARSTSAALSRCRITLNSHRIESIARSSVLPKIAASPSPSAAPSPSEPVIDTTAVKTA